MQAEGTNNHQKQLHMGQAAGIMKITVINKMRMITWKMGNIQEELSNLMGMKTKKRLNRNAKHQKLCNKTKGHIL